MAQVPTAQLVQADDVETDEALATLQIAPPNPPPPQSLRRQTTDFTLGFYQPGPFYYGSRDAKFPPLLLPN